jgi:hypothetical protein
VAGLRCLYVSSQGPSQFVQFPSFFNIGTVNVANSAIAANFAVPATAKLSGSFQAAALNPFVADFRFSATDSLASSLPQLGILETASTSSSFTNVPGRYELLVGRGRTYGLSLSAGLRLGTDFIGTLNLPVPPEAISVSGDTTHNFTLPQLPGAVKLTGRVTDSDGRCVKDVFVSAYTESIDGSAGAALSSTGMTDANGNFGLTVLRGKGYRLEFVPRQPGP